MLSSWADVIAAVASVIAALAACIAVFQIASINRQVHREFETQYLLRFWSLMDRRSVSLQVNGEMEEEDLPVLLAYLDLTEDQIALRERGRVTDDTWAFWAEDMRRFCLTAPISKVLSSCVQQTDYPRVRRLIIDSNYDPSQPRRFLRRLRGL